MVRKASLILRNSFFKDEKKFTKLYVYFSDFRLLEPSSGGARVDGRDITRLGLQRLRGALTTIPQDPVLFTGSLRFNLDPAGARTDPELWEALRHASLGEVAEGFADGLEHQVGFWLLLLLLMLLLLLLLLLQLMLLLQLLLLLLSLLLQLHLLLLLLLLLVLLHLILVVFVYDSLQLN